MSALLLIGGLLLACGALHDAPSTLTTEPKPRVDDHHHTQNNPLDLANSFSPNDPNTPPASLPLTNTPPPPNQQESVADREARELGLARREDLRHPRNRDRPSLGIAFLLRLLFSYLVWLPLGLFGGHHLLVGRNRAAIRALFTLNYCGLGWVCDGLLMPCRVISFYRARLVPARWNELAGDEEEDRDSRGVSGRMNYPRALLRYMLRRFCSCLMFVRLVLFCLCILLPEQINIHPFPFGFSLFIRTASAIIVLIACTPELTVMRCLLALSSSYAGLILSDGYVRWLPRYFVAVCSTMASAMLPFPSRRRIRRPVISGKVGIGWLTLFLIYWGSLLAVLAQRSRVLLSVDGVPVSADALGLLAAVSCAFRPDRAQQWILKRTEPLCCKAPLEALLRRGPIDQLCFFPKSANVCFDWDPSGTRWARVGFSLVESYRELGLSSKRKPSAKVIKAAYRKKVLAHHPDRLRASDLSPSKKQAQTLKFMRTQRAYETVMADLARSSGKSGSVSGAQSVRGSARKKRRWFWHFGD